VIIVDASVGAKWFLNEVDAPKALALLGSGSRLSAPSILRLEIASAIVRAFRTGRIARADAETLLASASAMLSSAAITLADADPLQRRAEAISLDLNHGLADCLYVALAEREGGELITADATLLARVRPHFSFVRAL
jgi:predicted nucleic acid-binding protein